jgi:hypothetical protein
MDQYATVVALVQEELDLVVTGRFDQLEELDRRRQAAMAGLPAIDPPGAAPILAHALELQQQVTDALTVARAGARSALDRLTAGRATVEGYRLSTGAQASSAHADYRG